MMADDRVKTADDIISANRAYWSKRARTYSESIRDDELTNEFHRIWFDTLNGFITERFPDKDPSRIHVLDIGTGPGFFSIILAEAGYQVTGIDLTPSMLLEARKNAGPLVDAAADSSTGSIEFLEMNAEDLAFAEASFDVIVTRNLTWDLPHPKTAYTEWHRILAPGGLLLNFDANWYRYLFDDNARASYDEDRVNADAIGRYNENPDVDYGIMEEIAARIPLSSILRPDWDIDFLKGIGFDATSYKDIWKTVWSEEDKVAYASTPMFLVHAVKR